MTMSPNLFCRNQGSSAISVAFARQLLSERFMIHPIAANQRLQLAASRNSWWTFEMDVQVSQVPSNVVNAGDCKQPVKEGLFIPGDQYVGPFRMISRAIFLPPSYPNVRSNPIPAAGRPREC